ncbi:MAG: c-type cytochrome [Bacteroidia bacterium]|nr:c-type cytochrome [Bacteroidia bacterium]MBT8269934.1 c-type cytochrome [Bacteroidia bacterium]NNF83236.1 cytochrome c [Flavobacteriaceae bacterium]NNK71375.1 cytochrome c [Flavobacteriaceae bacterium]
MLVQIILLMIFLIGPGPIMGQSEEWKAPEAADKLVNPLADDAKAVEKGKRIYYQVCAVCHGRTGVGDGPTGKTLATKPADHTSKAVQDQSDGALFWKISKGRDLMPTYLEVFSKTQRWQLVTFIRTLKNNDQ